MERKAGKMEQEEAETKEKKVAVGGDETRDETRGPVISAYHSKFENVKNDGSRMKIETEKTFEEQKLLLKKLFRQKSNLLGAQYSKLLGCKNEENGRQSAGKRMHEIFDFNVDFEEFVKSDWQKFRSAWVKGVKKGESNGESKTRNSSLGEREDLKTFAQECSSRNIIFWGQCIGRQVQEAQNVIVQMQCDETLKLIANERGLPNADVFLSLGAEEKKSVVNEFRKAAEKKSGKGKWNEIYQAIHMKLLESDKNYAEASYSHYGWKYLQHFRVLYHEFVRKLWELKLQREREKNSSEKNGETTKMDTEKTKIESEREIRRRQSMNVKKKMAQNKLEHRIKLLNQFVNKSLLVFLKKISEHVYLRILDGGESRLRDWETVIDQERY